MYKLRVLGGARLTGVARVTGAKNSVLKLMAAALLAPGTTSIREVPDILDVEIMARLLRRLGADVGHDRAAGVIEVTVPELLGHQADYDLVRRMRASVVVLGPLLTRTGAADVAMPGGDAIGSRGVDFHVAGLVKMGAEITSEHGFIVARAPSGLI
ncbi:MAG: UDP-N-acetylglucosamine 1-carboxyvinyltransferase, partial [Actinomycetes bacterium]